MMLLEVLQQLFALFLVVCTLTFFISKENYLFDFAEQMRLGALALVGTVINLQNLRTPIGYITGGRVTLVIPLLLGFFGFFRLTRYRWIARYSAAILAGCGVGVSFSLIIKSSVVGSVTSLLTGVLLATPDLISGIIKLVCGFGVMFYFLYSTRYSSKFHEGKYAYLSRIGRAFIMIYLGFGFLTEFVAWTAAERTFVLTYLKRTILRIISYATAA